MCHEWTGSTHPQVGVKGFVLVDTVPALCYYCHEESTSGLHGHRPVSDGECLSCHNAHGSPTSHLLEEPDITLCLGCHDRDYEGDSSVTENIRRLVTGNLTIHSAIAGGGCLSCHRAHGSGLRALLTEGYPEVNYMPATVEKFSLCFLCHDTDLLEAEYTEWGTGFREGNRNLHFLHIRGTKGRNCKMCHNLHGAPGKFLIEKTVPFGQWQMELNFIPMENGGSCRPGCHGEYSYYRQQI